jgi:hypothetical protein
MLLFLDEIIGRTLNTFLVSRIEETSLLKLKPNTDTKILHKGCCMKLPLEVCFEINHDYQIEGCLWHRNSDKYRVRNRCKVSVAIASIVK